MKRLFSISVAIALVMLMYGTTMFAFAEHTFSGKIMMVDPKLKIFIVKGNNNDEMTFHVRRTTEIIIGGEPKLLGELRKGEDVTVTYGMAGHLPIAKNARATTSSAGS